MILIELTTLATFLFLFSLKVHSLSLTLMQNYPNFSPESSKCNKIFFNFSIQSVVGMIVQAMKEFILTPRDTTQIPRIQTVHREKKTTKQRQLFTMPLRRRRAVYSELQAVHPIPVKIKSNR